MLAYFLVQDPEENLTHGFTANTTKSLATATPRTTQGFFTQHHDERRGNLFFLHNSHCYIFEINICIMVE